MKNKLSLKALKQEIELLNSRISRTTNSISDSHKVEGHDSRRGSGSKRLAEYVL